MFANSEGANTVSKERSAFAGAAANEAARVSKEAERVRDDLSSAISGMLAKFGDFSTGTSAA
jgi:hypothetical protein